MKTLKAFRLVGYLEGISLLMLLFVAMPLKHLMGLPLAVKVAGWIHGLLFIGYVGLLASVQGERNWPGRRTALGFLAAVLPFGTFVFDRSLAKESQRYD